MKHIELLKYARVGICHRLDNEESIRNSLKIDGKPSPMADIWIQKLNDDYQTICAAIADEEDNV